MNDFSSYRSYTNIGIEICIEAFYQIFEPVKHT